jgi:hypothetical protein
MSWKMMMIWFISGKEQLTHFKIKKVNEEEFKDPFAWWRTCEVHFSGSTNIGDCGILD